MKMKKMLAVFSALCMIGGAVPMLPISETAVISASAEEGTEQLEYIYENFKYKKADDHVSIIGYVEKPAGALVIPAEIDGLPVTCIEQGAFEFCEDITSLTLPDTLTTIASNAFHCTKRTNSGIAYYSVRSKEDENAIQTSAFYNCIGLKEIHVSDTHPTLSSVDGVLFDKDKTEIIRYPAEKEGDSYTIPETVTKIAENAFSGSAGLTSVMIPDSVTEIGSCAFEYCTALTSAVIPEGITSVKAYTFAQCTALDSVTIPESVAGIGVNAFFSTPWLTAQEEANPLVIINHILLSGKNAVGDIVIPEDITDIETRAFANNETITSVVIPASVTNIVTSGGNSAFLNCHALTAIEVSEKNSVYASTDGVLFNKKQNILIQYPIGNTQTEYTIPASVQVIADSAFYNAKNLISVNIPEGVTTLSARSFYGCAGFHSVTIPESVARIGTAAFNMCLALESVTIQNRECSFSSFTFSNHYPNFSGTIYVLEGGQAQASAEQYYHNNFALIGSAPAATDPKTEDFKQGDADGSGEIDILDVITVNKAILGKENLTENGLKAIDFNGNSKPDSDEALTILKYIVGLIENFA